MTAATGGVALALVGALAATLFLAGDTASGLMLTAVPASARRVNCPWPASASAPERQR